MQRKPGYNTIQQSSDVQSESGENPTETLVKELLDGKPEGLAERCDKQDGHERAKSLKYDKYIEPTDLQIGITSIKMW